MNDATAGVPAVVVPGAQSEESALAVREEALRVIREYLDAPGTENARRVNALKLLSGRIKARIAMLPEGREVLMALAFDAVLQGGASGGQLKALALLLNAGKTSMTMPSGLKLTARRGNQKIEVVAGGAGEGDED